MPCSYQVEIGAPWLHHAPPETTYSPVLNLQLKRNDLGSPPQLQICLRPIQIIVPIGRVSIDCRRVQRDSESIIASLEG